MGYLPPEVVMWKASAATTLAERLKRETHDLHAQAERAGVMADLMDGTIELGAYCGLLRNLHFIYATLEEALDGFAWDTDFSRLFRLLRREASLARDLDALHPGDWRGDLVVETSAQTYGSRLRALAHERSVALVAHGYTRYLGDLHGGQILTDLVRRRFALKSGEGTRFYSFGGPDEVLELRASFRSALMNLAVGQPDTDRIVGEARWAFEQHRLLFEEVKVRYAVVSS